MLFNLSERKGIVICIVIIIAIVIIPRYFLPKKHDMLLLAAPLEVTGITSIQEPESRHKSLTKSISKPELKVIATKVKSRQNVKKNIPLELNSADSIGLVRLRGIGPYYASKILQYRERLGGFQSVKQLKDLKMKYFDVDSLAHLFTIDTSLIHKSNIDSMSFKAILRHPYLEYEDVQMIFNAKRKYGKISYNILEKYKILANYKLKKIRPYFK